MAKSKEGQSSSNANKTKAGKKSGSYVEPPAPKPEKLEASIKGDRQFVAKEWPTPWPAPEGSWEKTMDVLCLAFGVRRIRPPKRDDTGMRYDLSRGQYVFPPRKNTE